MSCIKQRCVHQCFFLMVMWKNEHCKIILEVNKVSVWITVLHYVTIFCIKFKRKTYSLIPKASKDMKQNKYLISCEI